MNCNEIYFEYQKRYLKMTVIKKKKILKKQCIYENYYE